MQLTRGDYPLESRICVRSIEVTIPPRARTPAQYHPQRHSAEWVTGRDAQGFKINSFPL